MVLDSALDIDCHGTVPELDSVDGDADDDGLLLMTELSVVFGALLDGELKGAVSELDAIDFCPIVDVLLLGTELIVVFGPVLVGVLPESEIEDLEMVLVC